MSEVNDSIHRSANIWSLKQDIKTLVKENEQLKAENVRLRDLIQVILADSHKTRFNWAKWETEAFRILKPVDPAADRKEG